MVKKLYRLADKCIKEMKINNPVILTDEDKIDYKKATCCHICQGEFKKNKEKCKVIDHDHRTGRYRGAAHNDCNVSYFSARFLPVIMHNFRGYDSHLFIKKSL
jgi:intein-encoded DNA endonuclease-like protein